MARILAFLIYKITLLHTGKCVHEPGFRVCSSMDTSYSLLNKQGPHSNSTLKFHIFRLKVFFPVQT